MIKKVEVDTIITEVELNILEYIKKEVEYFDPKDKTPKSYLENGWGTLKIKNGYYYFTHCWIDEDVEDSYFYNKFKGEKEELSNFIKMLYEALDIKYQSYLKKKEENNYKSVIGKIKKFSPERIKELKQYLNDLK